MVKIRLTRLGKHKDPFYRIVATDSRVKRDGKYNVLLGNYEPFSGTVKIDHEKTMILLKQGAQPTETALMILKKQGIWKQFIESKPAKKIKAKKQVIKKDKPSKLKKPKIIKKSESKKDESNN